LRSLLGQCLRPDRVVLWIATGSRPLLPAALTGMAGLDIRETKDLGPYTKIVPALRAFPDAFLVTADDDVLYPPAWLSGLVAGWSGDPLHVPCHRAHRVLRDGTGSPLPYVAWDAEIDGPASGADIFPTGVGGVLYPPGALPAQTTDEAAFRRLAPRADDVWLYAMGLVAGLRVEKVSRHRPLAYWPGSQACGLTELNVIGGENDASLRRVLAHVGRGPPVGPMACGPDTDRAP
jgi:hypothetical protein